MNSEKFFVHAISWFHFIDCVYPRVMDDRMYVNVQSHHNMKIVYLIIKTKEMCHTILLYIYTMLRGSLTISIKKKWSFTPLTDISNVKTQFPVELLDVQINSEFEAFIFKLVASSSIRTRYFSILQATNLLLHKCENLILNKY